MQGEQPLVLASSVSLYELRSLESALKSGGFEVRGVDCAKEAHEELSSRSGRCVLVIDSGLLQMSDAQWRLFRASNPDVATVVRCWIPRDPGIQRTEARTFLVHPDHTDGLLQAVRILGAVAGGV